MTVENLAKKARMKGLDLLSTGDCLHEGWLAELEAALEPAPGEPGLLRARPELEARVAGALPRVLHGSLRYVAGVEVNCAPPGTPPLGGLHHLLFFPSLEHARGFRARLERHGDFSDGRPTLRLDSRQLLEELLDFDPACQLAPAHVFNPWFSSLGTVAGGATLEAVFGDLASRLLAVETGLTATPPMCRRLSCLDGYTLFSCSDAHSLENLGRECTLLDAAEPGFDAVMEALRSGRVRETIKVPVERTRYYLNWCGACRASFDAHGCPRCGRVLVAGSRDRLERVADRAAPVGLPEGAPSFRELSPLAEVLAEELGVSPHSQTVGRWVARMLETLGHERRILTELDEARLELAATPRVARAIVRQRTESPGAAPEKAKARAGKPSSGGDGGGQLGLGL